MILAAGLGTRLKPMTNTVPKALVEINNKTLLEIAILNLCSSGFDDIIINVHHFSEKVIEFVKLNKFEAKITISDESEKLLDTGGGLFFAKEFFDKKEPFLIYNVDILSDIDLKKLHNSHIKSNAIGTVAVRNRSTSRYLLFDENKNLSGWKNIKSGETKIVRQNQKDLTPLAFSGIQIIDPKIFELYEKIGKFSIIDVLLSLAKNEQIKAFRHDNDFWMDLGKPENLQLAEKLLNRQK